MQNDAAPWEDGLAVTYKTKHALTSWPSIHTPWYLLKELKTVHTKPRTPILIAALFITVQTLKQPRYPSVSEWIRTVVCPNSAIFWTVWNKNKWAINEKNVGILNVYY